MLSEDRPLFAFAAFGPTGAEWVDRKMRAEGEHEPLPLFGEADAVVGRVHLREVPVILGTPEVVVCGLTRTVQMRSLAAATPQRAQVLRLQALDFPVYPPAGDLRQFVSKRPLT